MWNLKPRLEMENILDTPESAERKLDYAGFWIRVAALIIDSIILYAINFVLIFAVGLDFIANPNALISYYAITIISYLVYFASFESSSRQGTPGKMAVGIKIGNSKGEPISFANALGRYFAKFLSGLILGIGYLMAGWDDKKQSLHDKLANTYVFYNKW